MPGGSDSRRRALAAELGDGSAALDPIDLSLPLHADDDLSVVDEAVRHGVGVALVVGEETAAERVLDPGSVGHGVSS